MDNPILVHEGKHLHMFKCSSGWEFASRKRNPYSTGNATFDAVVIVPILIRDGKVNLVVNREWREPIHEFVLGLPAGLIDSGESVWFAAKRELKEETGLDANYMFHVTPRLWSSEGMTDESVKVVYLQCSGNISTEFLQDGENISTMLVSRSEATKLMDSPMGKVVYFVMQDFINTGLDWVLVKRMGQREWHNAGL
jgi:ADP-ribose pyrophosphatase